MREIKPRKCKNQISLDKQETKNESKKNKLNLKKLEEVDLDAKDDELEIQNENYFDQESSEDDFKIVKKKVVKKKESKASKEKIVKTNKIAQKTQKNNKKSSKKEINELKSDNNDDSSDDEDDWEEVKVQNQEDDDEILAKMSKDPIEITIDSKKKRNNKKELDLGELLMKSYLKFQKTMQIEIHKTHLLCWLNHGFYLNNICNDDFIRGSTLSQLSNELVDLQYKKLNLKTLKKAVSQVKSIFSTKNNDKTVNKYIIHNDLLDSIQSRKCSNSLEFNLIALVVLRLIGFKCRLSIAFEVLPLKEDSKKSGNGENKKSNKNKKDESGESEDEEIELDDESDEELSKKKKKSTLIKTSKKRQNSTADEEKPNKKAKKAKLRLDEDEELVETNTRDILDQNKVLENRIIENKLLKNVKKLEKNGQILSEDDVVQKSSTTNLSLISINTEKMYSNYWLEVLIENSNGEQEWICLEAQEDKYDCAAYLEKRLERRVLYVFSFDNDNKVKDVTKRYSTEWNILSRKLRIEHFDTDKFWLEKVLMNYKPLDIELELIENKQLNQLLYQKPFPKSVSEFKDHPLYVLKRHLLKFQSIYPANAKPLGKFRNEDIYSRENLVTLHSKQTWLKYARSVKSDEEAYKVVKGRLKLSQYKMGMRENPDLDVFGYWQTKPYEPPIAQNGKIPRNEFGNVELFQKSMLPIGCVHLQLPNLSKICSKLKIDCAPAVVGFDAHKGWSHAVYDGYVICQEFKDTVLDAFYEDERNNRVKEEEKRKQKIYDNWKKLVKSLLIREKLKLKYGSKDGTEYTQIISTSQFDHKANQEEEEEPNKEEKAEIDRLLEKPFEKSKSILLKKPSQQQSKVASSNVKRPRKSSRKKKDESEEDDYEEPFIVNDSDEDDYKPKSKRTKKAPNNKTTSKNVETFKETIKKALNSNRSETINKRISTRSTKKQYQHDNDDMEEDESKENEKEEAPIIVTQSQANLHDSLNLSEDDD